MTATLHQTMSPSIGSAEFPQNPLHGQPWPSNLLHPICAPAIPPNRSVPRVDARNPLAILSAAQVRRDCIAAFGYPPPPHARLDHQKLHDSLTLIEGLKPGRGIFLVKSRPTSVSTERYHRYVRTRTDWHICFGDEAPGCDPQTAETDFIELTLLEHSLGAQTLRPTIIIVGSGAVPFGVANKYLSHGGRLVVVGFRDLMPEPVRRLQRKYGVDQLQLYDLELHLGVVRLPANSRVLENDDLPMGGLSD